MCFSTFVLFLGSFFVTIGIKFSLSIPTYVAELISQNCAVYTGAALQSDLPIKAGAGVPAGSKQGTHSRRIHQGIYDKESLL